MQGFQKAQSWCLFALLACAIVSADYCMDQTNCNDCVIKASRRRSTNCRWCPLDRACHTYGAVSSNPCAASNLNVQYSSGCPSDSSYATYSETLAYQQLFSSAIAYSNEPEECLNNIRTNLTIDPDFEIVSQVAVRCDGTLFDYGECSAVVAVSQRKRSILVSFRGTTETAQLIEETLSIMVRPTSSLGSGYVQTYFLEAYEKLSPCLTSLIEDLHTQYSSYTVRFSGHSLGGALASIAAFSFVHTGKLAKDEVSLYTYGMPRVGDKLYAVDHDSTVGDSFRLVNYRDCVPQLPPCQGSCKSANARSPYHHRTEVFYDTTNMQVGSAYTVCRANEDDSCSTKYHGIDRTPINFSACNDNHISYFGIHVGGLCSSLAGTSSYNSTVTGSQCATI